jgi:hypothetical protein
MKGGTATDYIGPERRKFRGNYTEGTRGGTEGTKKGRFGSVSFSFSLSKTLIQRAALGATCGGLDKEKDKENEKDLNTSVTPLVPSVQQTRSVRLGRLSLRSDARAPRRLRAAGRGRGGRARTRARSSAVGRFRGTWIWPRRIGRYHTELPGGRNRLRGR